MDAKNITFRKMTIRGADGKIIGENIVAVDRNEVENGANVKSFACVGSVDYSENPEGSFKPYTDKEKNSQTIDFGGQMKYFDSERAKTFGISATFAPLNFEDMYAARDAFSEAYPNIKVPSNKSQMEKLASEANLATMSAETSMYNASKEEVADSYERLKLEHETMGLEWFNKAGARMVGNYNTLSAFDKDFADATCKETSYAKGVAIISAADRQGLVKAPKTVDGFDMNAYDRMSLDATGVSLSHKIGHDGEGFVVTKTEEGKYEAQATKYSSAMPEQGQIYEDSISNRMSMVAIKARTAARFVGAKANATAAEVQNACKVGWQNYCNNVRNNYENVKTGLKVVGGYVVHLAGEAKQAFVAGADYAGEKITEGAKYVGNKAVEAKDAVVNGAKYVGDKAVDSAKYVGNKAVEAKDAVVNGVKYVGDKAVEAKDAVVDGAKDFAVGVKNGVVSKYNRFKNFLSDTYDRASNSVNRGIVNISDRLILGVKGVRDNAEKRIVRRSVDNSDKVQNAMQNAAMVNEAAMDQSRVME